VSRRSLLIGLFLTSIVIVPLWAKAGANSARPSEFELMHLWLTDIEAPALKYLQEVVEGAGVKWREHRVSGNFYGVRSAFAERLSLGVPPTAVFWIGGDELRSMVETKIIRSITRDATTDDLDGILRPEIVDKIDISAAYTSLPLVIHLQNVAVVNQKIFDELGITQPKSWTDFIQQSERIKSAGYIPLAMSDQRWQMRFLFGSIMSDGLNKQEFVDMLIGFKDEAWTKAQYTRAFQTLLALKSFANADSMDLAWQDVLLQVREGNAAMTITGDFAAPALHHDHTVTCRLAPGGNFVSWSFDVLAFTLLPESPMRTGQDLAIRALSRKDVLRNFALKKGGIPVLNEIKLEEFDQCSANSARNWAELEKVHFDTERWRLQLNSISSLAQAFWRADNPDPERYATVLVKELQSNLSD
jgi:glucose/mannose transport system substrate-binding protein